MTTATTLDVARGARSKLRSKPTCASSLRDELIAMLADAKGIKWPDARYWNNPVAFANDILGMRTWDAQNRILEAVTKYKRVTVRSGHKIGKSTTAAILALLFFCSFEDARVVMTSKTARQVDAILWRELGKIRSKAGCCLDCREACKKAKRPEPRPCPHSSLIGGQMNSLARSGFRAHDFREISGFTAREPEAVAGVSGAHLLYLVDEASGVDDPIFEAIEGNRAGDAGIVLFSNPTRSEGEFYLSHTEKALQFDKAGNPVLDADGKQLGFYYAIGVSSEETPNVKERRKVIPGLATYDYVEEKRLEWGEDSALYKIRIKGEFVTSESGKIISVALITEAEERWHASLEERGGYVVTPADGALVIGIDPAGEGGAGDESAFAVRRGNKVPQIDAKRGLSHDAHVTHALALISQHGKPREVVTIIIDRDGPDGYEIWKKFLAYDEANHGVIHVIGLRASDKAHRQPHLYDRLRDELIANLRSWLADGGEIPDDAKLEKELHQPEWIPLVNGRLKATPKDDIRKTIGRSPDRFDALALAAWQPMNWDATVAAGNAIAAPPATVFTDPRIGGMDPFKALATWGGRR